MKPELDVPKSTERQKTNQSQACPTEQYFSNYIKCFVFAIITPILTLRYLENISQ